MKDFFTNILEYRKDQSLSSRHISIKFKNLVLRFLKIEGYVKFRKKGNGVLKIGFS